MKISRIWNRFVLVFGLACWIYYLAMGLSVRFGQSLLWLWPAVGTFCVCRYLLFRKGTPQIPKWILMILRCCIAAVIAVFLAVECILLTAVTSNAPQGLDAIIVLGAKVNGTQPSGSLNRRIQTAAEYLLENPDTIVIASGGRGDDEDISEAECIRNILMENGIASERILLEDAATDTQENIINSVKILPDGINEIGIVTNNFHMFRSMMLAEKVDGYAFYRLCAPTTAMGFPHYMMREFCALAVQVLFK